MTETESLLILKSALSGDRGEQQQHIAKATIDLASTLLKKSADYGSSAWKPPVLMPRIPCDTAILVRMSDKIERIRNLLMKDCDSEVAESLDDTMLDLAGYAMLWLARPFDE